MRQCPAGNQFKACCIVYVVPYFLSLEITAFTRIRNKKSYYRYKVSKQLELMVSFFLISCITKEALRKNHQTYDVSIRKSILHKLIPMNSLKLQHCFLSQAINATQLFGL